MESSVKIIDMEILVYMWSEIVYSLHQSLRILLGSTRFIFGQFRIDIEPRMKLIGESKLNENSI